jgi:hypothetical protein
MDMDACWRKKHEKDKGKKTSQQGKQTLHSVEQTQAKQGWCEQEAPGATAAQKCPKSVQKKKQNKTKNNIKQIKNKNKAECSQTPTR